VNSSVELRDALLNNRIGGRAFEKSDGREAARRRIVRLILVVYWLLLFEGVLRKWILPQAWQYLFFIRDPFVLLVYFYATKDRIWPRSTLVFAWGVALSAIGLGLVAVELVSGTASPIALLYGWRNYFLYFPLVFIIGMCLTVDDLNRLVRQTLLVAIPISVVVVLQFSAPANAPINAGVIEGGLYQPGVAGGLVRTYGTFTSSAGESPFVASLVAMLLSVWIMPKSRRSLGYVALGLASAAVVTCLALSGSRGAFIESGVILASAWVCALLMKESALRSRALFLPVIILSAFAVLVGTVFAEAWQALVMRSLGAYEAESTSYTFGTVGRAFAGFIDFIPVLSTTPFLGYGLGTFGNAYGTLSSALLPWSVQGESDLARNVLELGPVVGLLYIGLRIALFISLARAAIRATSLSSNPLPLLLVAFCGVLLLQGEITGNGSVHGFGWLFAGFCMAANRLYASVQDISPWVSAK
jgi:hypothetical protein